MQVSFRDQAAITRKVMTEERRSVVTEIHFPSFSLFLCLFFSYFPRDLSLSLLVTSRLLYALQIFPPCAPPPRSEESSSTSRGRQVCRRHYSLSSPTVVLLCCAFFHNDLSSHYPSPSVYSTSTSTTTLLLQLAFLLLLLRRRRSLLLISLVSTSQGPFSRRSLLLTELYTQPLSPWITFT